MDFYVTKDNERYAKFEKTKYYDSMKNKDAKQRLAEYNNATERYSEQDKKFNWLSKKIGMEIYLKYQR